MKTEYFLLILTCALLSKLPVVLTMYFLKGKKINDSIMDFLNIIPYTSLSILIIRGIVTTNKEMLFITIISSIICVIVTYLKESISLSILSSVGTMYLLINILGI